MSAVQKWLLKQIPWRQISLEEVPVMPSHAACATM